MLNRSGKDGHLCFVTYIRGKACNFSLMSEILTVDTWTLLC
jgi:hypothetical protein